jgi:DNA-binding transcriptional LysR family regulator
VASGAASTPKGVVRVTAPPGVAYRFLAPLAARIRTLLPEVRLEVVATTTFVDLARREADLALRVQPRHHSVVTGLPFWSKFKSPPSFSGVAWST